MLARKAISNDELTARAEGLRAMRCSINLILYYLSFRRYLFDGVE
jgi:hypothetical protein